MPRTRRNQMSNQDTPLVCEMDKLLKRQASARNQFRKHEAELKKCLAKENVDVIDAEGRFAPLQKCYEELQTIDATVKDKMFDEDMSIEEIDVAAMEAAQFVSAFTIMSKKVSRLSSESESVTTSSRAREGNSHKTFSLPKIEICKFGGNLKEWLNFWSQFARIHENSCLDDAEKFHYLIQSMETGSEAKTMLEAYPITAENYPKAVAALKERYGNQDLLLLVYVRELLSLVVLNATQQQSMNDVPNMFMKLEAHLRALESLKLEEADPKTFIYALVESSLPVELLKVWQRCDLSKQNGDKENSRLNRLMEFLKAEVTNQQHIELATTGFAQLSVRSTTSESLSYQHKSKGRKSDTPATAASLFQSDVKSPACVFCGKAGHHSVECYKAVHMSLDDKKKKAKDKNVCFQCLKRGHSAKRCRVKVLCSLCQGRHVSVMCSKDGLSDTYNKTMSAAGPAPDQQAKSPQLESVRSTSDVTVSAQQSSLACSQGILLKTVVAWAESGVGKSEKVRVLFDDGCQRSCISSRAIQSINSSHVCEEFGQSVLFDGSVTAPKRILIHEVKLKSILDGKEAMFKLREVPKLGGRLPRVPSRYIVNELLKLGIQFSDICDVPVLSEDIDVVIGSDYYGKLITGQWKLIDNNLFAMPTIFGWTISGPLHESSYANETVSMFMAEHELTKLWNLELIGIRDEPKMESEADKAKKAEVYFHKTVTRTENGRYCVSLPFISEEARKKIPPNRGLAEQQLFSQIKKLQKINKYDAYDKVFQSWLDRDLIEEVMDPGEVGHFLPHHPVFKDSLTTPVRPVFNASSKKGRAPSLNDCLFKGPNYIESLPSALLRFREKLIGVVKDIEKAFQMILIRESDRMYLRFLWWDQAQQKIRVLQHKRVVFGVNCSPYLLAAVLKLHLETDVKDPVLSKKMSESLYVDNVVASVSSVCEYEIFKKDFTTTLLGAEMNLRGWERTDTKMEHVSANTAVLGVKWNKKTDNLSLSFETIHIPEVFTLRSCLAILHKFFDPIGVICPVLITPKILIQRAWEAKVGWDSPLSKELELEFRKWLNTIEFVRKINLPRYFNGENTDKEVHIFCDASQYAYAAVVYVRCRLDGINVELPSHCSSVNLLMAKSRIAPMKKISIPRLELIAAVLGVKLANHVKEALHYENIKTVFWSDSSTVLAWITCNNSWGTFVGNRVRKILEGSSPAQWRHVSGEFNPADLPSRGCNAEKLLESRWWEGPEWLLQNEFQWPKSDVSFDEKAVMSESTLRYPKENDFENSSLKVSMSFIAELRHGSYQKNVRIMAWILRFVKYSKLWRPNTECRNFKKTLKPITDMKPLNIVELRNAETKELMFIQSEYSFGNGNYGNLPVIRMTDGLYHIKTSLVNRIDKEGFKYPILLPSSHPLVTSLVLEAHKLYAHAGVQFLLSELREKYWIPKGRKTISKIIRGCVTCQRFDAKPLETEPAPLPSSRVTIGEVFETTGVDLTGPLYLRDGSKVWIVLFTCGVYRAVHLDLVSSLDTGTFINVLERFIFQYGRPNTIYSDNGTNFVGAKNIFDKLKWKQIEEESSIKKMHWIFNPPGAAWFGGFYERLIGSVKKLLKRMLGRAKLSAEELRSCLAAVIYVMNERPLTVVTEDGNDLDR